MRTSVHDAKAQQAVQSRQAPARIARVGVVGTGSCVPERVLTNGDLEKLVETSDEWILARTGVRERRMALPGQATSDLAVIAARHALEQARVSPAEVELLIVATATPDHQCSPPTACIVQRELGAKRAAAFDLSAACTGFLNALMTAQGLVAAGMFRNALVIGAEVLSSVVDYSDRESCILFGDGAGAVLIGADASEGQILDHVVGVDGAGADMIVAPAGGSRLPTSQQTLDGRQHYLRIQGRKVFKFAVAKMCEVVHEITARNGYTTTDIDLLIPHQANLRIIEAACQKLGFEMDRVLVNVDRYGNTSSASVPMALDEAVRLGRVRRGDLVCLLAFGGGLTWGASLLRW